MVARECKYKKYFYTQNKYWSNNKKSKKCQNLSLKNVGTLESAWYNTQKISDKTVDNSAVQ